MKVRTHLSTARELRKMSYRILRKMHDLEKPRKRQYIYSRKTSNSGDYYVLLTLKHMFDLMESALNQVEQHDEYLASAIFLYLNRLERLQNVVATNLNTNRPLEKRLVSKVLSAHTKVFRRMSEAGMMLMITESMGEQWGKVVLAAVATWGNRL